MLCASIHKKLALACAWVKEIFHLNVTKLYLELGTMSAISTGYTYKEILKLNVMTLSSTLCWYTQETSTSLCLGQKIFHQMLMTLISTL